MYCFWCCFMKTKTKTKNKIDINSIKFFKEDLTGMTVNPIYVESDDMNLFNAPKQRPKLNRKSRTELK
jgi:hypothetical protein